MLVPPFTTMVPSLPMTRRSALTGFALASAAGALPLGALAYGQSSAPNVGVCTLTPRQIEGPFYFDPHLVRADVTEGKPGIPLAVTIWVMRTGDCTPVQNARVDIWHSDAGGEYSGYTRQGDGGSISTVGKTFLRGTQLADKTGKVSFDTIYPGWYRGRATHIHFKVFLNDTQMLTSQLYFPEDVNQKVYKTRAPYSQRKAVQDTNNASDFIYRMASPEGPTMFDVKQDGQGYRASMIVGVGGTI